MHTYYIDTGEGKDGPHDLVSIMRRIRAGKIGSATSIYVNDADTPQPAAQIEEIALFFSHGEKPSEYVTFEPPPSIVSMIADGWRFTMEHNVMTVYAGGMLLLAIMLTAGLINVLGTITGGMLGWVVFILFHNIYLIYTLRLYRGQTLSADFTDRHLAPVLPTLLISCIVLALMMAGGLFLLLIPGLIVAVMYIFVPFLLFDHRYRMVEAMHASRLLLKKNHAHYLSTIALLVTLHLVCLLLIIPIPLTLPVFSAALCKLYEGVSSS